MRLLVVTNLLPPAAVGGYELECADVVAHLRRRHEVTVLTSRRGARAGAAEPGVLRELPFVRERRADSLRAPLHALAAARTARRVLAEARPELVYVWNGSQIPQAALRILTTARIPVAFRVCEHWFGDLYGADVFLRHLPPGETGLRGAWAAAMRAANRLPALRLELRAAVPAAISWNSEALRARTHVPPTVRPVLERVTLPSLARTSAFAEIPRRPADPPRILFVGRLSPEKGPEVALRALAALAARGDARTELVLAGPGEAGERDRLQAVAAALGIADRVRLPGPLGGDALAAEVAAASAWVVPSVWDEPAGLVSVEAALARVPAVLSRVGGLPEMLREDREEARFFARGDHEGCADALEAVLADGAGTLARVERAFARGRELEHGPYLAAMDEFLAAAVGALPPPGAPAAYPAGPVPVDVPAIAARLRALPGPDLPDGHEGRERWRAEAGDAELLVRYNADLAELAGVPVEGATVLDAGCGSGFPLLVLGMLGAARGIGIEVDEGRVEAARAGLAAAGPGLAERFEVHRADVADLPVADASVDLLISNESVGVYLDLDAFIREAARVVRPGGALVAAEANEALNPRLRRIGLELWEAYENGPAGRTVHGHPIEYPYLDERRDIVREALPDADGPTLSRLAATTSGMVRDEVKAACERFRETGEDPGRRYERGRMPVAPAGMVVERPVDPYDLARSLEAAGFDTRVHGYWGGASGRPAVRALNSALGRGGRIAIRSAPAFRVTAIRR